MSTQENCTTSTCCRKSCTFYFHIAIVILLIGSIAASIWAGCQVMKLEILKTGGKENWEKMQTIMKSDLYKERLSQEIGYTLMQIEGQNINADVQNPLTLDEHLPDQTTEQTEGESNNELTADTTTGTNEG